MGGAHEVKRLTDEQLAALEALARGEYPETRELWRWAWLENYGAEQANDATRGFDAVLLPAGAAALREEKWRRAGGK